MRKIHQAITDISSDEVNARCKAELKQQESDAKAQRLEQMLENADKTIDAHLNNVKQLKADVEHQRLIMTEQIQQTLKLGRLYKADPVSVCTAKVDNFVTEQMNIAEY